MRGDTPARRIALTSCAILAPRALVRVAVTKALPPGMLCLDLGRGCVLVIPERVYVAGLRLGEILRRREAEARRAIPPPAPETDR